MKKYKRYYLNTVSLQHMDGFKMINGIIFYHVFLGKSFLPGSINILKQTLPA